MKIVLLFVIFSLNFSLVLAQARLVINNGAYIVLNGGTSSTPIYLVQDNGATNALVRNTSGHIVSEGEFNIFKWNVGTNTGTYEIPFGRASSIDDTVWVRFNINTAGVGSGSFNLSTYRTATWDNNLYKPTPVTHVYLDGTTTNNSNKVIDRFYQIDPISYTTDPTINTLVLSYLDVEHTVASNLITEANLGAQYWKETAPIGWHTNTTLGVVNTTANRVRVASGVPSLTDVRWWTLTDKTSPLPVTLTSFKADCNNKKTIFTFETASEINSNYFDIVWQNPSGEFIPIKRLNAQGVSNQPKQYTYEHNGTFNNQSLFYLLQTDFDGTTVKYGPFSLQKACNDNSLTQEPTVALFPNPANENITLTLQQWTNEPTQLVITNVLGQQLYFATSVQDTPKITIPVASWTKGIYYLSVYKNQQLVKTLKFKID
jgi:hypothetical protein